MTMSDPGNDGGRQWPDPPAPRYPGQTKDELVGCARLGCLLITVFLIACIVITIYQAVTHKS